MPAYTDSRFPQPTTDDAVLWRYMDLPRLVALLSTGELYLSQLAALENDPWEGLRPPAIEKNLQEVRQRSLGSTPAANRPPGNPIDDLGESDRATIYVNC